MSHTRHSLSALATSLAACLLLAGCSSNADSSSSAAPPAPTSSAAATEPTTEPSPSRTAPASPPAAAGLSFSPKSGGKHLDDCQRLEPGDDPAEFLYYPVLVKSPTAITLDSVQTDHTQGVVDAAAWVAPAGTTPETGTFKGWPPPKIVTGDPNLQWSKRVPAGGAALDPGVTYNVFLRLQVDPTPGDSEVKGIRVAYQDAGTSRTVTWVAHTTFSMSC
jgi:hypothetical protein